MTYTEWMHQVDKEVMSRAYCSVHDLADYLFHDAYEDGATPAEVAVDVLEIAGFYK